MNRVARLTLETFHAIFLVIVNQEGTRARRTRDDLQQMLLTILVRNRDEASPSGLDDVEAP
jgi:hypothetical protein